MPAVANWINHTLTVTGSDAALREFNAMVGRVAPGEMLVVFDPARVVPEPEALRSHASAGAITDRLRTWRLNNWGTTKVAEQIRLDGPGRLVYSFRCAQSPLNREFITALAERAPQCSLVLEFQGRDYSGSASAQRGRLLDYRDSYDSYDDTDPDDDDYENELEGSDDPTER